MVKARKARPPTIHTLFCACRVCYLIPPISNYLNRVVNRKLAERAGRHIQASRIDTRRFQAVKNHRYACFSISSSRDQKGETR